MTPLAQLIAKQLTLPRHERVGAEYDCANLQHKMVDVHCFDLSAVDGLIYDIANKILEEKIHLGVLSFLPAKRTFIEWRFDAGTFGVSRTGYLLCETGRGTANVDSACSIREKFMSASLCDLLIEEGAQLTFDGLEPKAIPVDWKDKVGDSDALMLRTQAEIFAALALINSPRIVGRRTHLPHAGLQRKLARAKGMVGKFPLHAWTEIILEVTPPAWDGGECEARLSGAKARHFVRKHLRVRLGRLELVRDHWRGDPAIGLKRSRYTVVPPKAGAPAAGRVALAAGVRA